MVSESRVTWAASVPILVFLGLSVLDLGPMYETDRRQTKASLNAPPIRGGGIIMMMMSTGPSDCPGLRFNILSIDFVCITNCFYDYNYYEYPAGFNDLQ